MALDLTKFKPINTQMNVSSSQAALSNSIATQNHLDLNKFTPTSSITQVGSKPNAGYSSRLETDNAAERAAMDADIKGNAPGETRSIFGRATSAVGHLFNEAIGNPINELTKSLFGGTISKATKGKADSLFGLLGLGVQKAGELGGNALPESMDKAIYDFSTNHPDTFNKIANTLGTATDLGGIAGNILAAKGAAEAPGKVASTIKELPKNTTTIAPFADSFNKGAADQFSSEGIKPPVSAVTESPFLKGGEALASKSIFGRNIVDIVKNASAEIDKKVQDVISNIKPDQTMTGENVGKMLQQGLKEYEDNFKVTEGKVYDEFSKTYGKSNVYGQNTKAALQTLIKEQGSDKFKGVDNRLKSMFNRITGSDNPELKALNDSIDQAREMGAKPADITSLENEFMKKQGELDKSMTFDELKSTRSSVGEQLQKEPENTALKRLYGALSQDMQDAVSKTAAESKGGDVISAKEALDKLNQDYRTGKAKIESNIAQSISKSNPEQIANNLIKRNSSDFLKQVKEMVGPERFKEVSKVFMRKLFDESDTRGKFDITKLKNKLESYDKETLNELLTPEQQGELSDAVGQLEKFHNMGESLKKGQKMSEGSQTAFLQNVKGTAGRSGAIGMALLTGHVGVAAAILGEVGAEALFTKVFTSEIGRRFLTEGIKVNSPNMLKSLKQLGLSATERQTIIRALKATSVGSGLSAGQR